RKKIIEELQDISDEYFGKLKIEGNIVVGLANAYQSYANNIYKVAQAKAASEQVAKLGVELSQITGQVNQLGQSLQLSDKNGLVGGAEAARKRYEELQSLVEKGNMRTFEDTKRLTELTGKSEREIVAIIGKRESLRTREMNIVARMLTLSKQTATTDLSSIIKFPEFKTPKEKVDPIKVPVVPDFKGFYGDITNDPDRLKQIGLAKPIQLPVGFKLQGINKDFLIPAQTELERQVENLNKRMADIVNNSVNNVYSQIGEGLAIALSGGGVDEAFKGLLLTVAEGMKQLGESMIALGTAKTALEKFGLTPGVGTVVAGIAVVGLSALLKNSLNNIPKFAQGGAVSGATLAMVGDNPSGREWMLPEESLADLASRLNKGRGGEVFIPKNIIRGNDIVTVYERATETRRRNG
ncbi:MAG TPA: hypothetical protein VF622_20480, partial [Segetibacter sp.]